MNPILEKVTPASDCSFAIKEEILPYVKIGWHFHPEYELTLFTESSGKRFIGDNTDNFSAGDLLFLGPHLPHYMRNEEMYYKKIPHKRIRAIVVHFTGNFLGHAFFEIPEMAPVKRLLDSSLRGIHISGDTQVKVAGEMERLLKLKGFERLKCLLDILEMMANSGDQRLLASAGYRNTFSADDAARINKIFDHLFLHFTEEITLADAASLIFMSTSAFCKFFKSRTGKTFTNILNEIRIGHACKLFIEKDVSVSEVCYSCGYNNLSYFNRRFKLITKYSPLDYQKHFFV